jgi:uncharacterized membrane protein YgcG
MNITTNLTADAATRWSKQLLVLVMSAALLFATLPGDLYAAQDPQDAPPAQAQQAPAQGQTQAPPYAQQSAEQLQQLVAPIALYPDSLVAQILAASTFPEQVVEAERFLQSHSDLKGEALGQQVDQMSWDPSVKALTAFPTVLGNMDKNLSWTSSLGDAYYNQEQDVMNAVQVMRQRAQQAGNLKSTQQQTISSDGSDIVIQPADPQVVYVPAYNPWAVYGGPIVAWPGWYPYPGIWWGGPFLSFGIGFGIGWYGGFGWGWGHWGCNWHGHYAVYNGGHYYSGSRTFYNRNAYYHGGYNSTHGNTAAHYNGGNRPPGATAGQHSSSYNPNRPPNAGGYAGRGNVYNRPGANVRPFNGNTNAARGYAAPHGQTGTRSSAFSGYGQGGQARSYSSRGSGSFGGSGGGGGFHGGGGGGGSHGGGGHH